jgi:hypothetical protein
VRADHEVAGRRLLVLVVAVAGPLAGRLTQVQENDAVNWLPAGAESPPTQTVGSEPAPVG